MGDSYKLRIMSVENKNKKVLKILAGGKRGQASLEFILVIPFLILIIMAVSHLGLLIYRQNILEQAAREGARIVATTNSNQDARACIEEICSNFERSRLNIRIIPQDRASRKVGDMVEVIVSYEAGNSKFLPEIFNARGSIIKAKSIMRMECY
jgi:hypothetical protein